MHEMRLVGCEGAVLASRRAPDEATMDADCLTGGRDDLSGEGVRLPSMNDDGPDSMSPSERRIGVRHFACFPAYLERPDGSKRAAMIIDLSTRGALLVVRTQVAVGAQVSLELFVTAEPDARTRFTQAKVVRVEALDDKAYGPWSHRVAVQFAEELSDFEAEVEALEQRQRRLGLRP
jgi:hypothetical protein